LRTEVAHIFNKQKAAVMSMKSFLAEIVDGCLVLPAEAMALLPAGIQLRVITDSERGTVCIFAKDPMALSPQTEELMDALVELSEGLTTEEYSAPVSEEVLREIKRKRKEGGSAE
jgi:hypothetical protein